MRKLSRWIVILISMVMAFGLAEADERCPVCGGESALCFTDRWGAVYCSGTLVSYPSDQTCAVYEINSSARIIGEGAFAQNSHIQEVVIPEGVVMVQSFAFEGCSALKRVHFPETLLVIDDRAFATCPLLRDIRLPSALYCMGRQAFGDDWGITTVTLPASLRFIGDEAFAMAHVSEAFVYTPSVSAGINVFSPACLPPDQHLLLHFLKDAETEDVGDYEWIDALAKLDRVKIVFDLIE